MLSKFRPFDDLNFRADTIRSVVKKTGASTQRVAKFIDQLHPNQPRALTPDRVAHAFLRMAGEGKKVIQEDDDDKNEDNSSPKDKNGKVPPPKVEGDDIDELMSMDDGRKPSKEDDGEDGFIPEKSTDRYPEEVEKIYRAVDGLRTVVRGTDRLQYVRIQPIFHKLERGISDLAETLKDAPHPRPSTEGKGKNGVRSASLNSEFNRKLYIRAALEFYATVEDEFRALSNEIEEKESMKPLQMALGIQDSPSTETKQAPSLKGSLTVNNRLIKGLNEVYPALIDREALYTMFSEYRPDLLDDAIEQLARKGIVLVNNKAKVQLSLGGLKIAQRFNIR